MDSHNVFKGTKMKATEGRAVKPDIQQHQRWKWYQLVAYSVGQKQRTKTNFFFSYPLQLKSVLYNLS